MKEQGCEANSCRGSAAACWNQAEGCTGTKSNVYGIRKGPEMDIVLVVMGLVFLAMTSLRWGADSRFDVEDPELEQRPGWHIL
jgi:hypothetical protein